MPRMDMAALRAAAPPGRALGPALRAPTPSSPALFRRADLVVLPYREIDQSGRAVHRAGASAAAAAQRRRRLPRGRAAGAAELVPPGDADALRGALGRLLGDPARARRLAAGARAARATERYRWDAIAPPPPRALRASAGGDEPRRWRRAHPADARSGARPALRRLRAGRLSAAARGAARALGTAALRWRAARRRRPRRGRPSRSCQLDRRRLRRGAR